MGTDRQEEYKIPQSIGGNVQDDITPHKYSLNKAPEYTLREQLSALGKAGRDSFCVYFATLLYCCSQYTAAGEPGRLDRDGISGVLSRAGCPVDPLLVQRYLDSLRSAGLDLGFVFDAGCRNFQRAMQANGAVRSEFERLSKDRQFEAAKTALVATYASSIMLMNGRAPTLNDIEALASSAGYMINRDEFTEGMLAAMLRDLSFYKAFEKSFLRPLERGIVVGFMKRGQDGKQPDRAGNYNDVAVAEFDDYVVVIFCLMIESRDLSYDNINAMLLEDFNIRAEPNRVTAVMRALDRYGASRPATEKAMDALYDKIFGSFSSTLLNMRQKNG